MEQFVILLVIAAISLINWLLQKSADHKKRRESKTEAGSPPQADEPAPWEIPDSPLHERFDSGPEPTPSSARRQETPEPELEMRRLFEALGLPTPEPTPPPIVAPPPLPQAPPPLVTPVAAAKPSLRENREMKELAAEFERNALDLASDTGTQAAFRNLLNNPHEVRQGIILREILGPPKALEN